MTILTSPTVVGVDVAKAEIVVYREDLETIQIVVNERKTLGRWLKTLPAQSSIALEATSTYHLDTAELAHEMGHRVYMVDAYRLSHYRESIGQRAKTDPCDARLLARYLASEQGRLRAWSPPPQAYKVLKSLLHRRAELINLRVSITLSRSSEPLLKDELALQLKSFKQASSPFRSYCKKSVKKPASPKTSSVARPLKGLANLRLPAWRPLLCVVILSVAMRSSPFWGWT